MSMSVSHHERLVSALASCDGLQRAAFLTRVVRRAAVALAAHRPSDPRIKALERSVDDILGRLPAVVELNLLNQIADEVLRSSASADGEGEPQDRVGFFTAAAALILSATLSAKLGDPGRMALAASHVVHVQEQVYAEDEAVRRQELAWQAQALLGEAGPLGAGSILALPEYDPGPVYRGS